MYEMRKNNQSKTSSFFGSQVMVNLSAVLTKLSDAGSESTTLTLNWAVLHMLMYPKTQERVHDELDNISKAQVPLASERHNTPFIEAVLHDEVQRKGNLFTLSVQPAAHGGFFMPKGTMVILHLREEKRREEQYYFTNPETFDPNRYLHEGHFKPHPKVIPFVNLALGAACLENGIRCVLHHDQDKMRKEDERVLLNDKFIASFLTGPQPSKVKFESRLQLRKFTVRA